LIAIGLEIILGTLQPAKPTMRFWSVHVTMIIFDLPGHPEFSVKCGSFFERVF
jgi:hypothetical protein